MWPLTGYTSKYKEQVHETLKWLWKGRNATRSSRLVLARCKIRTHQRNKLIKSKLYTKTGKELHERSNID